MLGFSAQRAECKSTANQESDGCF